MEIQLQELIEQIKKDGVEAVESEAASIIASANAEAEKIISAANEKAEKILLDAKAENARLVSSSEDAIRQAGRNLLISFRESVARELCAVAGENIAKALSSEAVAELIAKVVESLSANAGEGELSVLLNSKDMQVLESALLAELKARLLAGVTLKANDSFIGGFRVTTDNGRVYYDYSAEAVTEMLSGYLNPRVTALMKEAEK